MQPSRMFNSNEMRRTELMREVAAMRQAETATASREAEPAVGPNAVAALGSLAFRIARWRRLVAREVFMGHASFAATPTGQQGRLTVAD